MGALGYVPFVIGSAVQTLVVVTNPHVVPEKTGDTGLYGVAVCSLTTFLACPVVVDIWPERMPASFYALSLLACARHRLRCGFH